MHKKSRGRLLCVMRLSTVVGDAFCGDAFGNDNVICAVCAVSKGVAQVAEKEPGTRSHSFQRTLIEVVMHYLWSPLWVCGLIIRCIASRCRHVSLMLFAASNLAKAICWSGIIGVGVVGICISISLAYATVAGRILCVMGNMYGGAVFTLHVRGSLTALTCWHTRCSNLVFLGNK